MALHYIVVDHYSRLFDGVESTINNALMAKYPPLPHALAGLISAAFGTSSFLSMHYTSMVFLFVIYCFIFLGLQQRNIAATLLANAMLVWIVVRLRRSELIYGYEIIGNFFLGQIAGEAVFLMTVFFLACRERSRTEVWALPLWIAIIGWVFPMGQIKAAGGAIILWLLDLHDKRRETGRIERAQLLDFAYLAFALVIIIGLHPAFHTILKYAYHEGGIGAAHWSRIVLSGVFAMLVLTSVTLALLAKGPSKSRQLFIAVAGLSTAGMALLQDAAHAFFNIGSDYGVRKHTYAVTMLLICSLISLAIIGLGRLFPRLSWALGADKAVRPILAGTFAAGLVAFLLSAKAVNREAFVDYQREIRSQPNLAGRVISRNEDFSPSYNFIASLGDFKINYGRASIDNLGGTYKSRVPLPEFALVSNKSPLPEQCTVQGHLFKTARLVRYDCR